MPRNIVIATTAITSIVLAAFLDSGGRNAGTPFETASTPVMAVQPFEKAVSRRKRLSVAPVDATGSATVTGCTLPVATCHAPTPIMSNVVTMKKYVGTAK